MNKVCLDTESPDVQQFMRELSIGNDGVEVELDGKVICRIVPSAAFSEAEKTALVEERWRIIQRVQNRTKGLPPKVIEREIEEAVDEVRQRKA